MTDTINYGRVTAPPETLKALGLPVPDEAEADRPAISSPIYLGWSEEIQDKVLEATQLAFTDETAKIVDEFRKKLSRHLGNDGTALALLYMADLSSDYLRGGKLQGMPYPKVSETLHNLLEFSLQETFGVLNQREKEDQS